MHDGVKRPPRDRPRTDQSGDEADERVATTEAFRAWLQTRIDMDRRSLHAIEVEAGIRGNALGKFLRGERGGRHGLTPLMLRRMAPVLLIGEIELLARAGHLTFQPGQVPLVERIVADPILDADEKTALIITYDRFLLTHRGE